MSQEAPKAPNYTTQQRFNLIDEMHKGIGNHLEEIYKSMKATADKLQDEDVARVRAERVISLIAHSTTGDYDWCRKVCQDYLNGESA